MKSNFSWDEIIEPKTRLFDLKLREVWSYRDLLVMWVKRDFTATYKQTILGPLWFFIQPLLSAIMFMIVFGNLAGLSTDGSPKLLFYLAGITIWNYFSESLTKTATVFRDNSSVFGKVYFPRLIMPLSIVVSGLVRFLIQFALFVIVLLFYLSTSEKNVNPNALVFITPLLLLLMAGYALGLGMIISALTTKYRDLIFLLTFGIQLFMYATPIIYPLSSIGSKYKALVMLNPITPIVETFRFSFLGVGTFSGPALAFSSLLMVVILITGVIIFNKVEKNFMDTV